jgi:hypothetical protein
LFYIYVFSINNNVYELKLGWHSIPLYLSERSVINGLNDGRSVVYLTKDHHNIAELVECAIMTHKLKIKQYDTRI